MCSASNPCCGSEFLPEEDRPGANRVCLVSHGLWQRRFGSDPEVIGKQLNLSGESYTVIGVLQRELPLPGRPLTSSCL
ncbi:MAG: ABC transporter permease [Pyrinomonadaceae bacterium]